MTEKIIWTIGHSTHSLDELLTMLKTFRIQLVADIRSYPGSRRYPHFNKESLQITLPDNGIKYVHVSELGGRRKSKAGSKNGVWLNAAFRGYADYMETDEFKNAIADLEQIALNERTVIMCSEGVWWRCHRSMVSDYLLSIGWKVLHIMGPEKGTEHTYTKPARLADGKLTYHQE